MPTPAYERFGEQLERYYSIHSPAKIGTVPKILKRWEGKEEELVANLELKYGEKFVAAEEEIDDAPPPPPTLASDTAASAPAPAPVPDIDDMDLDLDSPLSVAWKDVDLDLPLSGLPSANVSGDLNTPWTSLNISKKLSIPKETTLSQEIEISDPPSILAAEQSAQNGVSSSSSDELVHCWESVQADLRNGSNQNNNVQVAVRARPLNSRERKMAAAVVVKITAGAEGGGSSNHGQIKLDNSAAGAGRSFTPRVFGFDNCFDSMQPDLTKAGKSTSFASQRTVFEKLGYRLLANCWAGYNVSLLCYGQTGSGKSYSMQGSDATMAGEDAGILPRITRHLFYQIEQQRLQNKQQHQKLNGAGMSTDEGTNDFMVQAAYVEIFNEKIRDLLNPDGTNLRVREHPNTGVYVEDLLSVEVSNYGDVESLMQDGTQARAVASTNMNAASSRSHAIFTVTFTQTSLMKSSTSDQPISFSKVSKLNLIDLAGSEDQRSSGSKGARLKEAGCINKSLSALGNCISQLAAAASNDTKGATDADAASPNTSLGRKTLKRGGSPATSGGSGKGFVPYRDSKLTWLLCESLGGNAHTIMLATISPADCNFEETLSTLRYADNAKKIKTKATVNESETDKLISDLRSQIQALRDQIAHAPPAENDAVAGGGGGDDGKGGRTLVRRMSAERRMSAHMESLCGQLGKSAQWREENKEMSKKVAVKRRQSLLAMTGYQAERTSTPHLVLVSEDSSLSGQVFHSFPLGLTLFGSEPVQAGEAATTDVPPSPPPVGARRRGTLTPKLRNRRPTMTPIHEVIIIVRYACTDSLTHATHARTIPCMHQPNLTRTKLQADKVGITTTARHSSTHFAILINLRQCTGCWGGRQRQRIKPGITAGASKKTT
jgi:hypothetical protein